jgi:hypothetical protein
VTQNKGHTRGMRRRILAPAWVYFFGLFALAFLQRFTFPPDEHSVIANVAFFLIGAMAVVVVITIAQRLTGR